MICILEPRVLLEFNDVLSLDDVSVEPDHVAVLEGLVVVGHAADDAAHAQEGRQDHEHGLPEDVVAWKNSIC